MAYNQASVVYGSKTPVTKLLTKCRKHFLGDSYVEWRNTLARLPMAMFACDPTQITAVDIPCNFQRIFTGATSRLGQMFASNIVIFGDASQLTGAETGEWTWTEAGTNNYLFSSALSVSGSSGSYVTTLANDGTALYPYNRGHTMTFIGDWKNYSSAPPASGIQYDLIRMIMETNGTSGSIYAKAASQPFPPDTLKAFRPFIPLPTSAGKNSASAPFYFQDVTLIPRTQASGGTDSYTLDTLNATGTQNVGSLQWLQNAGGTSSAYPIRSFTTVGGVDGNYDTGYGTLGSVVLTEQGTAAENFVNDDRELVFNHGGVDDDDMTGIAMRFVSGSAIDSTFEWGFGGGVYMEADSSGNWVDGTYYSSTGLSSASYANVGGTEASTGKNYNAAAAKEYIAMSHKTTSQDIVFIYHFAEEFGTQADIQTDMQQMIETYQDACDDLSINCHHLIVTSQWHTNSSMTQEQMERNRDAARAVIDDATNASLSMANVSLYDYYGGVDMSDDTIAGTAVAAKGKTTFSWGTGQSDTYSTGDGSGIFDGSSLHYTEYGALLSATDMFEIATSLASNQSSDIAKNGIIATMFWEET